jgi:hypothetical protein
VARLYRNFGCDYDMHVCLWITLPHKMNPFFLRAPLVPPAVAYIFLPAPARPHMLVDYRYLFLAVAVNGQVAVEVAVAGTAAGT